MAKNIISKLEVWQQAVKTIIVTIPLIGSVFAGAGYVTKLIFQKEINDFIETVKFGKIAKDSILPLSERKHNLMWRHIKALEGKHNDGFAVGLRFNSKDGRVFYRHTDKKEYEAHFVGGGWYYFKMGAWHKVYP